MPLYLVGLMGMTRRLQHYDNPAWQPFQSRWARARARSCGRPLLAPLVSVLASQDAGKRPHSRLVRSLGILDSGQLGRFEALLDCTDPDLFDWIFGVSDPPPEHDHDVMQLLRSFCIERHRTPRQIGQHRI
jgi:hypothetical protein